MQERKFPNRFIYLKDAMVSFKHLESSHILLRSILLIHSFVMKPLLIVYPHVSKTHFLNTGGILRHKETFLDSRDKQLEVDGT